MAFHKVNQDNFDLVKTLADAGVKKIQIKNITGLGPATVDNIINAKDIDDYREIVRKQFERKAEYDKAKEERVQKEPQIKIAEPKKSYTVTMVINVDEDHRHNVAPLTALVNSIFTSDNVAVEVQRSDN